jgi:hypothetical protein
MVAVKTPAKKVEFMIMKVLTKKQIAGPNTTGAEFRQLSRPFSSVTIW